MVSNANLDQVRNLMADGRLRTKVQIIRESGLPQEDVDEAIKKMLVETVSKIPLRYRLSPTHSLLASWPATPSVEEFLREG